MKTSNSNIPSKRQQTEHRFRHYCKSGNWVEIVLPLPVLGESEYRGGWMRAPDQGDQQEHDLWWTQLEQMISNMGRKKIKLIEYEPQPQDA